MSDFLTRTPRMDEIPLLKSLWSSVFNNIGIDAFFSLFFKPELCAVVELAGSLAAMGYLIPSGDIKTVTDGTEKELSLKCAMIYSVGTLAKYRGLGLGTVIVNDLICLAGDLGYDAVVLCPSEDGLFEYYKNRTKLHEFFYINETVFNKPPARTPSVLPTEISIDEYLTVREEFPAEIVHIRQNEQLFKYQLALCNELGGGLFRIGDAFVVIERQSNEIVWVKELLMSGKSITGYYNYFPCNNFQELLSPIATLFPADEYLIRTPAKDGAGCRFGMINLCGNVLEQSVTDGELPAKSGISPWYGLAFD